MVTDLVPVARANGPTVKLILSMALDLIVAVTFSLVVVTE